MVTDSKNIFKSNRTFSSFFYKEYHPFDTTGYPSGKTKTEVSLKRYKYVGKERDEATGLYYYGARYYAAWLARFVSIDPLQFDYPQLTPYNYAGNKPVTHIDIDGMQGTGDRKYSNFTPAADATSVAPMAINDNVFNGLTSEDGMRLAAHSYGDKTDDILPIDWKVSERDFGIELDHTSGLKSQIYEREMDNGKKEYAYVFAGTNGSSDYDDDILQPLGLSKQFGIALRNAEKISNELKRTNSPLTFIGHSMGGAEAALASMVTGRPALTYNASGISNITKLLEGGLGALFGSESNIDAYILETDLLNIFQNSSLLLPDVNGNRHYIEPTDWSSVYNGHVRNSLLKSLGVKNPEKYEK